MSESVTIVGGGIGGLAVANALQRVGIDFTLYERAPALTEVGAGIGLSEGALRVLDALGLGDGARDRGVTLRDVYLASKHLKVRRRLPGEYTAFCIHRADLIDLLRSRLPPEKIHLSRRAVDIESRPEGTEVTFEDGARVSAPCVVAADGIHSALRQRLFPEVRVRYIDQTIWRGISEAAVPDLVREGYVEIWDDRLRFLTVPMDARRTLWLAVKPAKPGGKDDPETVREELVALFDEYHPALKGLILSTDEILRDDMADLGTPRRGWHHHRVVFVGDAIHATTPNLAQGGCQALEDALCLALCLNAASGDYGEAFDRYYQLRRKKVDYVVRTSWMFGRAAHTRNPLHHHLYRAVLEYAPSAFVRRQEALLSDLTYLHDVDRNGVLDLADAIR